MVTTALALPPALHYGTASPDLAAAAVYPGDVVLQAYHPLVVAGAYASTFPQARRYLYANLTSVALDDPRLDRLAVVRAEPRWGLARLDLTAPESRRHVVDRAVEALALGDEGCAGLFLDDLDLLLDTAGTVGALALLGQLDAALQDRWPGRRVALFANRGFALWAELPALDAVLCEGLAPSDVDALPVTALPWLHAHVLPELRALAARGVPAYGLTYLLDDSAPTGADARLVAELLAASGRTDRHLSTWTGDLA